jgi:hypothetical protein
VEIHNQVETVDTLQLETLEFMVAVVEEDRTGLVLLLVVLVLVVKQVTIKDQCLAQHSLLL